MQIIPLSTSPSPVGVSSTGDSRPTVPLLNEERDTVELSSERPPPLGQAEALPGQGESPKVIGLCPDCGRIHALSVDAGGGSASPVQTASPLVENAPKGVDAGTPGESPLPAGSIDPHSAAGQSHDEAVGEEETDSEAGAAEASEKRSLTGEELTDEQRQEVERLKERDREVRAHEQAHVAAGGQYVGGGVQFEYETGPNGRRYAVGGEVSIDSSPVSGDPQKTIQKAQQIRRAAMAPAEPSGADHRAAASASQMEAKARQEVIEERMDGGDSSDDATEAAIGDVLDEGMDVEAETPSSGTDSDASLPNGALDVNDVTGTTAVVEGSDMDEGSGVEGSISSPAFDVVTTGDDEASEQAQAPSPMDVPEIDGASIVPSVVTLSYADQAASPAGSFVDLYR